MNALPDYDAALQDAIGLAPILDQLETVTLDHAAGRALAQAIVADRDLPPFNRAQMDGYALRAAEVGTVDAWPVAGRIAAGEPADLAVPPGTCVKIATGAPLPGDVDTVIQHELSDRGDPVRFTIDSIEPGHAVHPRGADAEKGSTLIPARTRLASHHIGIAATTGASHLSVVARPRVTVLTSGDEIRPLDGPVETHQVRNSNGPMLAELLGRFGAAPIAVLHVLDERGATIDAVGEALDAGEMVVTVGGVSAGERDFFPDAFDAREVTSPVRGAAIQPGRPIRVGADPRGRVVVALPGNPVSALACACLFVWPIVRAMQTLSPDLPWREVELATGAARSCRPRDRAAVGRLRRPRPHRHDRRPPAPAGPAGSGGGRHAAALPALAVGSIDALHRPVLRTACRGARHAPDRAGSAGRLDGPRCARRPGPRARGDRVHARPDRRRRGRNVQPAGDGPPRALHAGAHPAGERRLMRPVGAHTHHSVMINAIHGGCKHPRDMVRFARTGGRGPGS
jgi:molybdopterin molybdotransferase